MSAVAKSRSGIRSWTDAQRAEQAAKLRARKIWLKSTGPRTTEGKIKSSANARKSGYDVRVAERAEIDAVKAYLRTHKSYITLLGFFAKQRDSMPDTLRAAFFQDLNFLQNELIASTEKLHSVWQGSGRNSGNIIPFSRVRRP